MNGQNPAIQEPVIIVGAGPAGCTVSLLLADSGIPRSASKRAAVQPTGPAPTTMTGSWMFTVMSPFRRSVRRGPPGRRRR